MWHKPQLSDSNLTGAITFTARCWRGWKSPPKCTWYKTEVNKLMSSTAFSGQQIRRNWLTFTISIIGGELSKAKQSETLGLTTAREGELINFKRTYCTLGMDHNYINSIPSCTPRLRHFLTQLAQSLGASLKFKFYARQCMNKHAAFWTSIRQGN